MNRPLRWFRTVPSALVSDYERLGWLWRFAQWTHDGSFHVAQMEYLCCCRPFDRPPTLSQRKEPKP